MKEFIAYLGLLCEHLPQHTHYGKFVGTFFGRAKLIRYIRVKITKVNDPQSNNKTLGRARDPRANSAWLNKITE